MSHKFIIQVLEKINFDISFIKIIITDNNIKDIIDKLNKLH